MHGPGLLAGACLRGLQTYSGPARLVRRSLRRTLDRCIRLPLRHGGLSSIWCLLWNWLGCAALALLPPVDSSGSM